MSYQLTTAKIWNGSAWVDAAGGAQPWYSAAPTKRIADFSNVTVQADTAAHTKGAWAEVVSSLADDASLLLLHVSNIAVTATNTATLIDVGVGAAGSETVIAANIAVGGAVVFAESLVVALPVAVASGSRVACRIQSVVTGGKTARVDGFFYKGGTAPTTVDVLGTSTATSQGTSLSGASGSYTQVVASTAKAYKAIAIIPSIHNATIANINPGTYTLAKGSAGSEQDLGQTRFQTTSAELVVSRSPLGSIYLVSADLPAGSRLSVKHDIFANPDRYGVTLIGIT